MVYGCFVSETGQYSRSGAALTLVLGPHPSVLSEVVWNSAGDSRSIYLTTPCTTQCGRNKASGEELAFGAAVAVSGTAMQHRPGTTHHGQWLPRVQPCMVTTGHGTEGWGIGALGHGARGGIGQGELLVYADAAGSGN